jgi:hypothetical protein
MATVQKTAKARKVKAVGILGASTAQRSKWATAAWKDPDLRKRLGQVLKDNAERAKLRNLRDKKEATKKDLARLKVLEAKVGQKAKAN